ncbi:hypothetical protein B0H15DRAFT_836736 [Mycena belliarum]|uniref:Uncharacterized protein n=1 Tax=Mycena belliarum TaxID=1033014 RepID=A0AAD6U4N9_9AGAR|nr:hypothetical protein B0H15DRAFT_836736 [Mycena belliae]
MVRLSDRYPVSAGHQHIKERELTTQTRETFLSTAGRNKSHWSSTYTITGTFAASRRPQKRSHHTPHPFALLFQVSQGPVPVARIHRPYRHRSRFPEGRLLPLPKRLFVSVPRGKETIAYCSRSALHLFRRPFARVPPRCVVRLLQYHWHGLERLVRSDAGCRGEGRAVVAVQDIVAATRVEGTVASGAGRLGRGRGRFRREVLNRSSSQWRQERVQREDARANRRAHRGHARLVAVEWRARELGEDARAVA